MNNPKVRNQFSTFDKPTLDCSKDLGKTQQSFKDEVDINKIVKRFTQTGIIEHQAKNVGQYSENNAMSFTEAMFAVKETEKEFMQLPHEVRAHFENDAATYLDAITDPERISELQDIGLIEKPPEAKPEAPAADNSTVPNLTPAE